MKRTLISAILIIASAVAASAQDSKPIVNPPRGLVESLKSAGNFNALLSLLEKVELNDLGVGASDGKSIAGQATPGTRYQTLFAPNDGAFSKLPQDTLEVLKKDPARLRTFLLAHMVPGKVLVADVLTPVGDGTSRTYKELKSRQGWALGFSCDGHTGLHQPRINGKARVGKFQDVFTSDYLIVIHEIDAVLFPNQPPSGS